MPGGLKKKKKTNSMPNTSPMKVDKSKGKKPKNKKVSK